MGPSKKAKRIRSPAPNSRTSAPLPALTSNISTEELLSSDRADELRELVAMLLQSFDEAPQALVTLSQKTNLHPDANLAKHMEAWFRDARYKHSVFLETEFVKTFPREFPSLVVDLIEETQAHPQIQILKEARILWDRSERAITIVHGLRKFWDGIVLVLQHRAEMDHANVIKWSNLGHDDSIYEATIAMLSHSLLMNQHIDRLEDILQRLKQFWGEYLHLDHIDLDNDIPEAARWDMQELFAGVDNQKVRVCEKLRLCHPFIFHPRINIAKHP